jgi:hypothetical protein
MTDLPQVNELTSTDAQPVAANRRQHHRIEVRWRARLLKKGHSVAGGVVTNASLGGVFVETALESDIGDIVLVEMHLEGGNPRRVLCQAEIMRKISVSSSHLHGYGLRFTRIDDDDMTHLLECVAQQWSAQAAATHNAN